ncbi:MAG: HdeD family acid-resistance protein [Alphaproteobacteria bacterium]|nr:HdeD family acid-resistance protein [Alphaproteobacteria bacterium]MBL7099145.1 HdeD family acid-resistance protein [Alphaproteobacteria bacterium]
MVSVLVRNWWAFLIRGLLAIAFGLIAFFEPGVTMLSLVLVFAAYATVDGIFGIVAAVRAASQHERWIWLAVEGVVSVIAGIAAVAMPGLTVVVFVTLLAIWALITGALMLFSAFRVDADHGRWWLALGGVASLVYGALLIIAPMIGALVLTWWIGAYALVFGVMMLIFAFRLRSKAHTLSAAAV